MARELVSVVIPCFNGAEYIDAALDSILQQGEDGTADVEIIVVDDVSTDLSVEKVERRAAAAPETIRLLRQPSNLGPAAARNAGLRCANGRFVCFLDADDEYAPGFFLSALAVFAEQPRLAAVVCDVELVNCHREVHPLQHQRIINSLPSNLITKTAVARLLGGFPENPLFRGRAAGEDFAFRKVLSESFEVSFLTGKYLRYLVRRGSHFDLFLNRSEVVGDRLDITPLPEEDTLSDLLDGYRQCHLALLSAAHTSTVKLIDPDTLQEVDEFANLHSQLRDVAGFLLPIEGFALYQLARSGPSRGNIVEIGSFMGLSTCWLASGAKAAGRLGVIAVDHFTGSPEHQVGGSHQVDAIAKTGTLLPDFLTNIERKGLTDWVAVQIGGSAEIATKWSGPIRLLFIDADHSYEATRQDTEAWSHFVTPDGLMAFHDIGVWPGVTAYYDELLAAGEWHEIARVRSLCIVARGAAA
jgi:predicted O-methyltransferase YrrM